MLDYVINNPEQVIAVVTQIIGIASILAAMLGKPKAAGFLCTARKILDTVALNVANARNAKAAPSATPQGTVPNAKQAHEGN